MTRFWTLKEIQMYLPRKLWPGWCALWHTENKEDILYMLSPEYCRMCRQLCESCRYDESEIE